MVVVVPPARITPTMAHDENADVTCIHAGGRASLSQEDNAAEKKEPGEADEPALAPRDWTDAEERRVRFK